MTNNYFTIERSGKCIERLLIKQDEVNAAFKDIMDMSYDEIKSYKDIDVLVNSLMDATNERFDGADEQTVVTLIGPDDVFIWSIIMGPGDVSDELKYAFVDWKKDGKSYRYEKD